MANDVRSLIGGVAKAAESVATTSPAAAIPPPKAQGLLEKLASDTDSIFKPALILPDPNAFPGVVFRWVSTQCLGDQSMGMVNKRIQEGYHLVSKTEVPELAYLADSDGVIRVNNNTVLMATSAAKQAARERHSQELSNSRVKGNRAMVDTWLQQEKNVVVDEYKDTVETFMGTFDRGNNQVA